MADGLPTPLWASLGQPSAEKPRSHPRPARPGVRLPAPRALRPRGCGSGSLGARQRPRCSQAGGRVGVWSLQSAGPPPAAPFNRAPPRLCPDAPRRATGGQRSVTREGPPLGSGRRTGLPLESGDRGVGGAGAGMLGGPLGWGRRGSAPRAGRDPRLPVRRERGAGAQGEGTQECRAGPHSRSVARG